MRIALIAPPFIAVPPIQYGGTELFIAQLAEGLIARAIECVVYANGESRVGAELRSLYPLSEWPLKGEMFDNLKDINHAAWAVRDAINDCDVIHLNSAPGLVHSRFITKPLVYTVHHANEAGLAEFYRNHPAVHYVCISEFQRQEQKIANSRTIHHGVDMRLYKAPTDTRRDYFVFLGRIAPVKGCDVAIEVAKRTGVPLKIAGEVQPIFKDYFDTKVKPHIDGKFIEYIGTVGLREKNQLLGNAQAMLFPIKWHEPFGLVMIESMACGAPVIAMRGGSVAEVVREGESGFVCSSVEEMVEAARRLPLDPAQVRRYVEQNFSVTRMVEHYARLYNEICDRPRHAEVIAAA